MPALSPYTGQQPDESLCQTSLPAHHVPGITATRERHGHYRVPSSSSSTLLASWLIAIGLKESCLLMVSRWKHAVMRAMTRPKVVPEPSCEQDSCWKLEFILGAEYSQGLRADFSPCMLYSKNCFPQRGHSQPAIIISYSKLVGQNTP